MQSEEQKGPASIKQEQLTQQTGPHGLRPSREKQGGWPLGKRATKQLQDRKLRRAVAGSQQTRSSLYYAVEPPEKNQRNKVQKENPTH